MKKFLILMSIIVGLMFASCGNSHHHHKQTSQNVKCYHQKHLRDDGTYELLYWYILMGPNNNYYYSSSSTPVTSFSGVSWSTSSTSPIDVSSPEIEIAATETFEVTNEDFPADMQNGFEESQGFEGNETESTSESSDNSSSDNSSSDSGGDDSGGGGGD